MKNINVTLNDSLAARGDAVRADYEMTWLEIIKKGIECIEKGHK